MELARNHSGMNISIQLTSKMADVDSKLSTVSMATANVIDDDFGLGFPPWDISQVLLPVLCAIFIAIVIIVIACCLIQKKSKSSGVLRQKSSHTIETLHEVSDHDIYDVIDELRVKNLSSDKSQCRHGKIDYHSLLASHRQGPHSKLSNAFTTKSDTMSCQCASKFDILTSNVPVRTPRDRVSEDREALPIDARLSTNTEGGASSVSNNDDGIYETLDRHWTLKNEQKVPHSASNRLESDIGHKQSPAHIDLNTNDISETSSSQSSRSSQELQQSEELSSPYGDSRKLVCQISMFELSNEENKPALIETTYYQIQSQICQTPGANGANIPELLQKTNLRIVQDNTKETNPSGNLLLKPLTEDEVLLHQLSQSLVRKNSQLAKTTKIYEKLHKSGSKRMPTLLVKKSESFRTASSELHAAKERNRISRRKSDSSDIEVPPIHARSPTRQAHISAGPEATRILTKLGPLPPLPTPCKVLNQKTESTHAVDISQERLAQNKTLNVSLSPSSLLKKQSLSLHTDSEIGDQHVSNKNTEALLCCADGQVQSSNSDPGSAEFTARSSTREPAIGRNTEGNDVENNKLVPGMEIQNLCPEVVSTASVCRVRIDRVCDDASSPQDDEESNYYFVLEPPAGTPGSSRNSEVGSSSDCYDMGSTPDMQIHREAGDTKSRCSIEVPA